MARAPLLPSKERIAEKQELIFTKMVSLLCQRTEKPRLAKKIILPFHPEKQMGRKEQFETIDR